MRRPDLAPRRLAAFALALAALCACAAARGAGNDPPAAGIAAGPRVTGSAAADVPAAHGAAPDAVTPDGGRYYGPLVDGLRQGAGRVEWDNGARYDGGFARGLYEGRGRYLAQPGWEYVGEFHQGRMSGEGVLVTPGYTYRGHFRDNEFDGQGELDQRGTRYAGGWEGGVMQGRGRYETPGGEVFEGDFLKGAFTGQGSYRRPDGLAITGRFRDWKAQGEGVATDGDGTRYEGGFADGLLVGKARIVARDGSVYEGATRNWLPEGEGKLTLANGDVYTGGFAEGLYEGKGTLTRAQPTRAGVTRESGTWHGGRLDDPAARERAQRNLEAALYRQRELLDASIAALLPQDPARIDLYFIGVAGAGSQEVFHREVDYVRDVFDRSYGTRGRSLALVNSRNTVQSTPMATQTSVEAALGAVAARMDKSQDILFLFLTSHGSSDHELSLDVDGARLPGLGAARLGELVRATGIRYKVIVVSACYSGGFVDALADDGTLVITAARRDRTSFGCADDNDFTYFGRAFFKDALPAASSFEDAFARAARIVRGWEDRDIAEDAKAQAAAVGAGAGASPPAADARRAEMRHSEPQMRDTPAVAAQLAAWKAQLPPAARP